MSSRGLASAQRDPAEAVNRIEKSPAFARRGMSDAKLLADSVLKLPDAKRGEQEALSPRKRADGRQFFFAGTANRVLSRATTFPFGFPDAARGFADREMAGVIHGGGKKSFQASRQQTPFLFCRGWVFSHFPGHGVRGKNGE